MNVLNVFIKQKWAVSYLTDWLDVCKSRWKLWHSKRSTEIWNTVKLWQCVKYWSTCKTHAQTLFPVEVPVAPAGDVMWCNRREMWSRRKVGWGFGVDWKESVMRFLKVSSRLCNEGGLRLIQTAEPLSWRIPLHQTANELTPHMGTLSLIHRYSCDCRCLITNRIFMNDHCRMVLRVNKLIWWIHS